MIDEALKATYQMLEEENLNSLLEIRELQILEQALFQHEAERLKREFGEDHPRTLEIMSRLRQNQELIDKIEVSLEMALIRVPEAKENEAIIHGRVTDENLRGIRGLVVYLENAKWDILREMREPETSAQGYYSFVVDEKAVETISRGEE